MKQDHSRPSCLSHYGERPNLAHKPARPHAGANAVVPHFENHCGDRAEDGRSERRRQPYPGIFHDVRHLYHRGAKSLRYEPADAVLAETHHGKTYHLARTSGSGGAGGEPGEPERNGKCRARNRKGENHAHDGGDNNAHHKRMKCRRGVYHRSKPVHQFSGVRGEKNARKPAYNYGSKRNEQNVYASLALALNHLAGLSADDGGNRGSHWLSGRRGGAVESACAYRAHHEHRQNRQRRSVNGARHPCRYRRPHHVLRHGAQFDEQFYADERPNLFQYQPDNERGEEAQPHSVEHFYPIGRIVPCSFQILSPILRLPGNR